MKRLFLPTMIGVAMMLSGCGDQLKAVQVYEEAITATEQLESITFQRNQTLTAQQESFRSGMEGVIEYNPLQAYAEIQMNLLNLTESLDMEMYVTDNEWRVRPNNPGATWQARDRNGLDDIIFENPARLFEVFQPYSEEFLMKESEILFYDPENEELLMDKEVETIPVYEVSFRGSDEQYRPLVLQHVNQMGLADRPNINMDDVMESIDIERIDMTIFVDVETFDVHRFQTRFRYTVEILDEYRVIDESLLLRFQNHNEPVTIEEKIEG